MRGNKIFKIYCEMTEINKFNPPYKHGIKLKYFVFYPSMRGAYQLQIGFSSVLSMSSTVSISDLKEVRAT